MGLLPDKGGNIVSRILCQPGFCARGRQRATESGTAVTIRPIEYLMLMIVFLPVPEQRGRVKSGSDLRKITYNLGRVGSST